MEKTPGSQALHERARALLPNGVTHVGRYLEPYPIYVDRAAGSHKFDVDGNQYVDYFGGHGALLLGHNHPAVIAAIAGQLERGTHYGASHALEVEWAALIHELVPSAERIRFTASGTEATHLAIRLSRAFTRKSKIVRFAGHFHGWHDHVCFPQGGAPGVVHGIADETLIVPPHSVEAVEDLFSARDDIAALIVEPTGATFGQVPLAGETLHELRALTSRHNILLIFDEVITGFRCSPGGAQRFYAITPDLTTLAKIMAGGMPGAAVVGRANVLNLLDYSPERGSIQPPAIAHQGTFNAAPVSAAAGIATLVQIRDTDAIERANRTAGSIRAGINAVARRRGFPWCAYGAFSDFHLFPGDATAEEIQAGKVPWEQLKGGLPMELIHKIRVGFLLHGVDIVGWPGGLVSAAHTDEDAQRTVDAFEATLDMLAADGGW
jgi:glutamate-1-semialdehyde 2,1-aminomutase